MTHPQWVSPRQAVRRRVMFEGRVSRVVDYFGGAASASGPQAYLVEQRNYVLRPHFHPVDQFQILCGAPGSLFGRRPLGELEVHYADAHTVYGPLTGGDPPLRYFTLRAEPTGTTAFMPESAPSCRPAAPGGACTRTRPGARTPDRRPMTAPRPSRTVRSRCWRTSATACGSAGSSVGPGRPCRSRRRGSAVSSSTSPPAAS